VIAPAQGPGSPRFRSALAVVAAIYFAGVFFEVAAPFPFVPRPLRYLMQVAKLFPNALDTTTEYRAEAYFCDEHVYREIDVRPFFPIRPDDKENRFERALFFYHHHGKEVMRALDDYLVTAANRTGPPVGGVLFLSLRIPVPPPGQVKERYRRKPLVDYPPEARKVWYTTPSALRRERCHEQPESPRGPPSP
jgi:hypothetical protein